MKDWKKYFLGDALELGYSYFINKKVGEIKFKKKKIIATISTTQEKYEAVIDVTENLLFGEMFCNCPCTSNTQCPHLASVLFAYNKQLQKKNINNITYLISHADDSQIRQFLKIILKENKQLVKRFQRYVSNEASNLRKNHRTEHKISASSLVNNDPESLESKPTKKKSRILSVKQMDILNYSKQQIQQAIQENWESPAVRLQYIDYLLQNKLYKEAEEVLKESIDLDSYLPQLVLQHRYSLKNLYQKLGKKEAYINQLTQLLIENESVDMNLIHQLKKACSSSEWEKIRNCLFKELRNHLDIGLFYSQEKRYDLLLDHVLETPGLTEVNRYFNLLKKQAPEALLQKYEYELRKMAHTTTTRFHYQKMALHIEEMAKLPNSMVSVQLLIKEIKKKYPRKKAMIQEISLLEKKI
ncbi:hypothetical protein [Enterococcus ratti]|uniref:SWIM-type domain-containing protein n=1 Tax=Enterococcus ratti TaxID=150033 RepID=A0A1L8WRV3_9ENTE|nr:hypothetical protein [Enterococcus ratti]OJG83713.1 hypothetical protein RV14_GL000947 [Enterococcus ratti]